MLCPRTSCLGLWGFGEETGAPEPALFFHIPSPAAGSGFQGPQKVPAASPRCPRRLLEALTAALALFLLLCSEFEGWQRAPGTPSHPSPDFPDQARHPPLPVSWWVAQRWQPKGIAGDGNASLGIACWGWDGIVRELRRILCPPRGNAAPGGLLKASPQ